jgi:hypothetical protein
VALFVTRALDATSKRKDWIPRKDIPRRKIKRVLHSTEKYLASARQKYLDDATKWWNAIPKSQRRRQFVGAVGDALYVARRVAGDATSMVLRDPWEHVEAAFSQVELDKRTLERIEIRVRLRDLTNGLEKYIDDEDVRLACAAACDIGRYDVARDIARRAVGKQCQ